MLAPLTAGCFGGGSSSSSNPTSAPTTTSTSTTAGLPLVSLKDNYFDGGNKTLSIGTTVTFRNDGAHAHTVTIHHVSDPTTVTVWNQTLQPGQTTAYPFALSGTYHVWCRFHGTMTTGMAMVETVI